MRLIRLVLVFLVAVWVGHQIGMVLASVFGGSTGGTAAVLALIVTGFAVAAARWRLRLEHPWLWWPIFGAAGAVVRMVRTWRATCEGMGLSVPAKRFSSFALVGNGRPGGGLIVKGEPLKLIAPRRVRVRVSRCALILTVRLHPGQTPAEWERAGEAFAHQWRVYRVRCESPRPGFITLTGLGFDPLRYPPPPKDEKRPGAGGIAAVSGPHGTPPGGGQAIEPDVLRVSVGVLEDGQPWVIDLTSRAHYLVTGATRSGKSTLTVRFVAELAARPVALVGIDAKNGMELSPFAPRLSALATTRGEAAAAVDALVALMWLRTQVCRENAARTIWELPAHLRPEPLVVIVDEIAELFLSIDKEGKEEAHRCVTGLVRISQLGAGLGVHLWICGQRFGSDLGAGATLLRAQLSGRICHRVADHETAVMTLAGLPGEAISEAERIGTDLAGVAVIGDDSGAWMLGRSHTLSMAQASEKARQYEHLTIAMPEVTAAIEGERRRGGGW